MVTLPFPGANPGESAEPTVYVASDFRVCTARPLCRCRQADCQHDQETSDTHNIRRLDTRQDRILHERWGSGAAMAHGNPASGSGRKRGEKPGNWPPARSGRPWHGCQSGSVGMIRRSGRLTEGGAAGGEALEPTPAGGPAGLHEALHPTGRTVEPAAEVLGA